MKLTRLFIFAAAASAMLLPPRARADSIDITLFGLDVNSFDFSNPTYPTDVPLTWELGDTMTVNTTIRGVTISPSVFGDGPGASGPASLTGDIAFSSAGIVDGGSVTIGAMAGGQWSYFTVYPDPVQPAGLGMIQPTTVGGNSYKLNAVTENGAFSMPSFAGISLAGLNWQGGIVGSLAITQSSVELELRDNAALVPLPGALMGGGLLLGLIGAFRFRKNILQKGA